MVVLCIYVVCACCLFMLCQKNRRRHQSYNMARPHLMAPMNLWQYSTPSFGAEAFCITKWAILEDCYGSLGHQIKQILLDTFIEVLGDLTN